MLLRKILPSAAITLACGTIPALVSAEDTSLEQLRQTVQEQQGELEQLREQLEATAEILEGVQVSTGGHTSPSAQSTTIGGYGELHYNNIDGKDAQIDFHRFVLFFGHRFSDRIRFYSELELEHALSGDGDDKPGEVELEQAYIGFDLNDRHTARAGVFLIPVGILNETHEPTTFYGVERNPVEKNIIPTTWWEGGVGLNGEIAQGWSYDLAVTSGLNDSSYSIRSGRQKVAKATAENFAYTGRLRWTGIRGVEIAGTVQFQDDITQGVEDVSAVLLETHAIVNRGPFGLRALYATWDLDGEGPKAAGRDEQTGWYIEPSWKISPKFGFFARYNEWDNEAGSSADTKKKQTDVGVNFWPHEQVVIKADIQRQDGAANEDGFNLGIGYHF